MECIPAGDGRRSPEDPGFAKKLPPDSPRRPRSPATDGDPRLFPHLERNNADFLERARTTIAPCTRVPRNRLCGASHRRRWSSRGVWSGLWKRMSRERDRCHVCPAPKRICSRCEESRPDHDPSSHDIVSRLHPAARGPAPASRERRGLCNGLRPGPVLLYIGGRRRGRAGPLVVWGDSHTVAALL